MRKKVLLIDDETAILAAMRIRFRAAGYQIVTAADGATGLRLAASCQPDVIVLDIRMPDMDGLEVCQRLKADPGLAAIPVIFLSANVQEPARQAAREVGGAVFIPKPYQFQHVIDAIENVTRPAAAVSRPLENPNES